MIERDDRSITNKKAVLAFVFGLASVVFAPAAIPAIILWYLALRDIRRTPHQKGIRLARVGVLVGLVVNIVVLAAIVLLIGFQELVPSGPDTLTALGDSLNRFYDQSALTSMFRKTRQANEEAVLETLHAIRDSLNQFYGQSQGYPRSLQELANMGLLRPRYAQSVMHGYVLRYSVSEKDSIGLRAGSGLYSRFFVTAEPSSFMEGKRVFFLNEAGAIHVYPSMAPDAREERLIPPPATWGRKLQRDSISEQERF